MTNIFGTPEKVTVAGFPFSKLGSLKRKEEAWFQEQERKQLDGMTGLLEIAQQIAQKHGISDAEAFNLVASFGQGSGDHVGFLVEYADKIDGIKSLLSLQQGLPAQATTLLIQSRVPAKWLQSRAEDLKDAFDIEVVEAGWMAEHTDMLPVAVIEQINEFAAKERSRWQEVEVDEEEEDLGKDLNESEASAIAPTPTGTKSTGRSKQAA